MSWSTLVSSCKPETVNWENYMKYNACVKILPGVINDNLLEDILRKEKEGTVVGRMDLELGIKFENVHQIRIDFKNILKIDHLWVLENLRILKLDNNYIEKIENIETLIHLTELDLSFNKIVKIENLDTLVNLEKLSLFDNLVSDIENMDKLKNLAIFSIGRNQIWNWQDIVYLRRFPKLRSLNLAENPLAAQDNFRFYVAAFLPDLSYYEYRRISQLERELGVEIFNEEYLIMLEKETEELGKKLIRENEEQEAQLNADSFVEYLNTHRLFESFYENDQDGKTFLLMGGEEVETVFATYEENITSLCKDIFNMGQVQYGLRQKEIDDFTRSKNAIGQSSQDESITHVENFTRKKDEIFSKMVKSLDLPLPITPESVAAFWVELEDFKTVYDQTLHITWKVLMKLETTLNEQLMELHEAYELIMTDLINNFIEQAQGMFAFMREVISNYSDNIQEIAKHYYATVVFEEEEAAEKEKREAERRKQEAEQKRIEAKSSPSAGKKRKIEFEAEALFEAEMHRNQSLLKKKLEEITRERVPDQLKPFMKDKDILMTTLATSKDAHLLMLDNREDLLISRARDWLEQLVKILTTSEVQRNRDKLVEINDLIDKNSDEFDHLAEELIKNIRIKMSMKIT